MNPFKDNPHSMVIRDLLIKTAKNARNRALAHRSDYKVGAAVIDKFDIYEGFNVEFDTQTSTVHAEVAAVINAMIGGSSKDTLLALAVAVLDGKAWFPCGICRQVLAECNPDMWIIAVNAFDDSVKECSLRELLPDAFSRSSNTNNKT